MLATETEETNLIKCLVWVTGEEAFLECVSGGKRTSAGFWGFGHWKVKDLSAN